MAAAAGAAGGDPVYVDDVFSTYVYVGDNTTGRDIVNGIDLAGEGGLVWIKKRNVAENNVLIDTERGANKFLMSDTNDDETTTGGPVTDFNSNGFEIDNNGYVNTNTHKYVSWTFRKQKGFFDVVTWTGDGNNPRSIAHNLGSVPGCIIIKCRSDSRQWIVYHRSVPTPQENLLVLNETDASVEQTWFADTAPTSTHFTVEGSSNVNASTKTYVAYLFAHDDQRFGEDGDESIIKCGIYTGSTSASIPINLGFEPQWVLIKQVTGSTTAYSNWAIFDNMRGIITGSNDPILAANLTAAEGDDPPETGNFLDITGAGFIVDPPLSRYQLVNANASSTYIYMAIRRPHKTPEAATEVFGIEKLSGSQSSPAFRTGILTDMGWARRLNDGDYYGDGVGVWTRLTGSKFMGTGSTSAEGNDGFFGDNHIGFYGSALSGDIGYSFKRAPGFFDIVAYTGTGSVRTVTHNLEAVPELLIVKRRNYDEAWDAYVETLGNTKFLEFDHDDGEATSSIRWNDTSPTSSAFTVSTHSTVNASGGTYVAYLFATLPGISKVGTYSGTGNDIDVDCGFTAGARLVIAKRTDASGGWYFWDTERGITAGDDPHVLLNDDSAEVNNNSNIDPHNPGFQITDDAPDALNASGGTYIYLAIA